MAKIKNSLLICIWHQLFSFEYFLHNNQSDKSDGQNNRGVFGSERISYK